MKIKKIIYLFLIAVIMVAVSCAKNIYKDSNQTGLLDQSGNLIKDTLIYTNKVNFNTSIPIWAKSLQVDYIVITNIINVTNTNYQIVYGSNYYLPNLPPSPTDYYRISVPWARGDQDYYTTVSYKDIDSLKQLWLDQINRRGAEDGKVFAIRNRANNRGYWYDSKKPFQEAHPYSYDGTYDYYYFADNGDIVYKGGDKTHRNKDIIIKKFVGAVIVDYRTVSRRWNDTSHHAPDVYKNTGEWTVGAIYKMAIPLEQAKARFASGDNHYADGVYDFIAARKEWWYWKTPTAEDKTVFERQYYNTDFLEVLVLNPHANENWESCLGIDAYYAYYGDYRAKSGEVPVKGFTEKNMPYMTDEYAYLGQRPEYIVSLLNHTTTFTDASRRWKYLAVPGHAN